MEGSLNLVEPRCNEPSNLVGAPHIGSTYVAPTNLTNAPSLFWTVNEPAVAW